MKKIVLLISFLLLLITGFSQVTQQQTDSYWSGTATGTNTYTVTISKITATAPYNFQRITVNFGNANTGAATLRVIYNTGAAYAAKGITLNGSNLVSGDIQAGINTILIYNTSTSKWQMQPYASGGSISDWKLTGNAGTVDGTNFIGTTDNIPFNIRVNNLRSGRIDQTLSNTFFGYEAGLSSTTGIRNTATGTDALKELTTGNGNSAFGVYAALTCSLGINNTAIGFNSLQNLTTQSSNTGIGAYSGYTVFGNKNVFLGDSSGFAWIGSERLFIGNPTSPYAFTGDFSTGFFGIGTGTVTPGKLLDLGLAGTTKGVIRFAGNTSGNVTIQPLAAAGTYTITLPPDDGTANQFLQTDGNGITSWASASTSGWNLDGNTVVSEKWLGTVDNFDLPFRTNNTEKMILSTSGNLGIGSDPTARLHVKGSGATVSTVTALFENSASVLRLKIYDSGQIEAGTVNNNLFIGIGSGLNIIETVGVNGINNTTLGVSTMPSATTATNCTAIGYQALNASLSVEGCTAIGVAALKTVASGAAGVNQFCTAVGQNALMSYNTAAAEQSTAFGAKALENATNGINDAFGYQSLNGVTTGASQNSAFGNVSLLGVTNGDFNVAFGRYAGGEITTGTDNTFIGRISGSGFQVGSSFNTIIGSGAAATGVNRTASNNTFVGYGTGLAAHGNGNVFLGYKAGTFETGASKLFIDNAARASEADARIKALIYGVFGTDSSAQELKINGELLLTKGIDATAGDAATIQAQSGRFRKDATGTTFTLTNANITANSIVIITYASDPGITGFDSYVVAGAGSAVITFTTSGVAAAPTNNTDINFLILNNL